MHWGCFAASLTVTAASPPLGSSVAKRRTRRHPPRRLREDLRAVADWAFRARDALGRPSLAAACAAGVRVRRATPSRLEAERLRDRRQTPQRRECVMKSVNAAEPMHPALHGQILLDTLWLTRVVISQLANQTVISEASSRPPQATPRRAVPHRLGPRPSCRAPSSRCRRAGTTRLRANYESRCLMPLDDHKRGRRPATFAWTASPAQARPRRRSRR
jgi:hypothetical protein